MGFQDVCRALAGGAMVFGLAASPAVAAPTTYQFSGRLTQAGLSTGSVNPEWAFADRDAFSGTLVYDPAAVANSYDYIDTPDWKLSFHTTPVVSLSYTIQTATGSFTASPAVAGSYAAVGAATAPGNWTGVDLRFQNYPLDGTPQFPVPAGEFVGDWYAHSSFLSLFDYNSQPLTDTGADVDLAALFAALPVNPFAFSVRFSDPSRWNETPGIERIDGILYGQIDSFAAVSGAVPEPATWAMMILGVGAVGGAARRRGAMKVRVRFA